MEKGNIFKDVTKIDILLVLIISSIVVVIKEGI